MRISVLSNDTADGWLARVGAIVARLQRFPLSILQFAFRFAMAAIFFQSGLTKIASWQTTLQLFKEEYQVPLLSPAAAATMAATVELSCPVLLILGLATRLATLPMLGMTFVIGVFVYPEQWPEHLTWASMLLFVLTRGPGKIAIDGYVADRFMGIDASSRRAGDRP